MVSHSNKRCTPRRLFAGAPSWSCGSIARFSISNYGKGWQGYRVIRCVLVTSVPLQPQMPVSSTLMCECLLLQVRGATRPTHFADVVEDGLSTFRRAHARHVATQQLVSGNVSDQLHSTALQCQLKRQVSRNTCSPWSQAVYCCCQPAH